MTETDDLLRELVAETRVQTEHLKEMKRCMEKVATTDDLRRSEQMMMKSAQDRKDEHDNLRKTIKESTSNGAVAFNQKLIIWLIIALFAAFGLTRVVEFVVAGG
jgi:hypothetical protein